MTHVRRGKAAKTRRQESAKERASALAEIKVLEQMVESTDKKKKG